MGRHVCVDKSKWTPYEHVQAVDPNSELNGCLFKDFNNIFYNNEMGVFYVYYFLEEFNQDGSLKYLKIKDENK